MQLDWEPNTEERPDSWFPPQDLTQKKSKLLALAPITELAGLWEATEGREDLVDQVGPTQASPALQEVGRVQGRGPKLREFPRQPPGLDQRAGGAPWVAAPEWAEWPGPLRGALPEMLILGYSLSPAFTQNLWGGGRSGEEGSECVCINFFFFYFTKSGLLHFSDYSISTCRPFPIQRKPEGTKRKVKKNHRKSHPRPSIWHCVGDHKMSTCF